MAHLYPNIGWVPRGSGAPVIQAILKQGHVLYSPEQGNDSTSSGFGFGGGARGLVVYLLYHRNIATYITIMRSCLIKVSSRNLLTDNL